MASSQRGGVMKPKYGVIISKPNTDAKMYKHVCREESCGSRFFCTIITDDSEPPNNCPYEGSGCKWKTVKPKKKKEDKR
jgi:hypothetical protein